MVQKDCIMYKGIPCLVITNSRSGAKTVLIPHRKGMQRLVPLEDLPKKYQKKSIPMTAERYEQYVNGELPPLPPKNK